jgi:tRNA splicing ligase
MSDMAENVQETIDQTGKSKINSRVALFVAITATFMALCNVKDGNIVQAMSQAQAHSIDSWSYFQAKSTKQSITENALELLKVQNTSVNADIIKKYEEQIARYEKEKTEIKTQAEGFQKEYDDTNLFDDQFDMTEALLTISMAMFGITALTQKRWLLYFSSAVSLIGIILGLTAFMKISLHSDLVSKILG